MLPSPEISAPGVCYTRPLTDHIMLPVPEISAPGMCYMTPLALARPKNKAPIHSRACCHTIPASTQAHERPYPRICEAERGDIRL